ncbi:coat protein [ssRNA phage SRR6960803_2]|uniref:Coat protein n=1 Tax=ssRNA phage SRR6960803_2 TaxID=2786618 RepID=A0A8S5KZU1_9VIRU|nr:coat protein [ssRNA phage SRR6960803_2]DAD50715.1 TPA_asm: coat protein [ssRNA phage SRR6960803_2]
MTWSLSAVTGGAQTGFTTPGYTPTLDTAPDVNGRQHAITALTGTQAGVRSHSSSDPFTVTFYRPKSMKTLQSPNPVTGKYTAVPKNTFGLVIRKGVNFAANNAPQVLVIRTTIDVPAGSDSYDSSNIRAAASLFVGALNQNSAGLGDTLITGIMG